MIYTTRIIKTTLGCISVEIDNGMFELQVREHNTDLRYSYSVNLAYFVDTENARLKAEALSKSVMVYLVDVCELSFDGIEYNDVQCALLDAIEESGGRI